MSPAEHRRFPALEVRNYRLYWIGSVLTNNGRWAQYVATYFITYQLTGSATWVGLAGFANFVPMLLVNPVAGWISDNLDRRRFLRIINGAAALTAAAMAAAWAAGLRNPSGWVGLFFLNGVVSGLMIPVGQAFVADCVPQRYLRNAITLNSTQFNAARALGPAIGGLILGMAGVGWTLAAVVLFYGPKVACLSLMDPLELRSGTGGPIRTAARRPTVVTDYRASVQYVLASPGIVTAILTVSFISTLAMPVVQQIVVFAEDVFEVSPFLFGLLGSAQGLGAVLSAPMVAGGIGRLRPSAQQFGATIVYGTAVAAFALAPTYAVAFVALAVVGVAHLVSASNLNSVVQLQVDDAMRGRVMAIYMVGVLGPAPFANLLVGWLISVFGPRPVVALCGGILALAALLLRASGRLQHLDTGPGS
ncbi:MAG: MFS transporter [Actinomycetota bacterium]|nr:MFS transporter [Actinomycetota bacterium]